MQTNGSVRGAILSGDGTYTALPNLLETESFDTTPFLLAFLPVLRKKFNEVEVIMERLEADTIICPIVYDGYGQIYIDHEPVSVPLPETLYILMGAEIAMHRMERDSAWVTPEGAAFLAACRTSDHLPEEYHVSKIGTGRGTASDGSNGVLRIMVLEDGNAFFMNMSKRKIFSRLLTEFMFPGTPLKKNVTCAYFCVSAIRSCVLPREERYSPNLNTASTLKNSITHSQG